MIFKKRLKKLAKILTKSEIDCFFVSNPNNIYFLGGYKIDHFKGYQPVSDPEAFLLISKNENFILADSRNEGSVSNIQNFSYKMLAGKPNPKKVAEQLAHLIPETKKIAFEFDGLIFKDMSELSKNLKNVEITDGSKIMQNLRLAKDPTELKLLKKAADITGKGFEYALTLLKNKPTEKQLAKEITKFFIENADGNSFDPIVAFREGSAIPHYKPGNKIISGSGMLLIDLGCMYKGYCGDMTRMVYLGKPTKEYIERYNALLTVQNSTIKFVAKNKSTKSVDDFVRDGLKDFEKFFLHGTGHGVGLDIHEPPYLNQSSEEKLKSGMVFSIEPGIYFQGGGGIRIEDLVYIDDNKLINLTKTPKKLLSLEL